MLDGNVAFDKSDNRVLCFYEICSSRFSIVGGRSYQISICLVCYCVRIGTSIRIDIVMQSLPNHFKKLNMLLVDVIQIAFFAYCLKGGVNVTQSMINSGQSSPALNAPMYFVYGASAVGFALGIARSLQHMLTIFKPEKIDAKTAKVGE